MVVSTQLRWTSDEHWRILQQRCLPQKHGREISSWESHLTWGGEHPWPTVIPACVRQNIPNCLGCLADNICDKTTQKTASFFASETLKQNWSFGEYKRKRGRWMFSEVIVTTHRGAEHLCCCCCSVAQLCPTLCSPMDCSTLGLPVPHHHPVCPSSCSLYQWCHLAVSLPDTLFSFCPRSIPASGTFPVSCLFASDDQNILELQL